MEKIDTLQQGGGGAGEEAAQINQSRLDHEPGRVCRRIFTTCRIEYRLVLLSGQKSHPKRDDEDSFLLISIVPGAAEKTGRQVWVFADQPLQVGTCLRVSLIHRRFRVKVKR